MRSQRSLDADTRRPEGWTYLEISTEHIFVTKICHGAACFRADEEEMAVIGIKTGLLGIRGVWNFVLLRAVLL